MNLLDSLPFIFIFIISKRKEKREKEKKSKRMSTVSCSTGVYDCAYRDVPSGEVCADYDGNYEDMEGRLWILITSCLVMCAMAFGMGSNDAGMCFFFLFFSHFLL